MTKKSNEELFCNPDPQSRLNWAIFCIYCKTVAFCFIIWDGQPCDSCLHNVWSIYYWKDAVLKLRYPWKLRHSKNLVGGQEQEAHGSHHSPEEPLIYTFVSIWLTLDQWFSIKQEKENVKNFNRACSFTGNVMGELTHPQTKKFF